MHDAIEAADNDTDGLLSFDEFLVMTSTGSFNFPWPQDVKLKLKAHAATEAELHHNQAARAQHKLRELFDEADVDRNGALHVNELTAVMKQFYSSEGTSRSRKAAQREVAEAMSTQHLEESQSICYRDFLEMVARSDSFNFGESLPREAKYLLIRELEISESLEVTRLLRVGLDDG